MVQSQSLVRLDQIRTDGGTQPRAQLDFMVIGEYADLMIDGIVFPPITVFYDGADYWLADGFHRLHAAKRAGLDDIGADVRQGTLQDAQWYSYSVNQAHGLRRSNEDKRRAVEAALKHEYASKYSNRELARHCGVDEGTVRKYRDLSAEIPQIDAPRLVTRNGTTYEMNTASIGSNGHMPRTAPPVIRFPNPVFDDAEAADLDLDEWETSDVTYVPGVGPVQFVSEDDALDPPPDPIEIPLPTPAPMAVHFSSATPEWYTPRHVIERVLSLFGEIDLDPCSNAKGAAANVPAGEHFTQADDGLAQRWHGRVYMNPPYGDEIGQWTARLLQAYQDEEIDEAIALLPARTDTAWFRPLMAHRCCFVHGRLKFSGAENSAPFPSVIVYLGPDRENFIEYFSDLGTIMERAR